VKKSENDFSKSQRKKLQQNVNASVVCETCKRDTESAASITKPVSIMAQTAKSIAQITAQKVASEEELVGNDPSLQYYKHPMKAPIVKTFKTFFKDQLIHNDCKSADIFYNRKKDGWRTASKLPVRSEIVVSSVTQQKQYHTKIGLFSPGSHTVLECLASPIHHAAINNVLVEIKASLERVGLYGYHESIGDNLQEIEQTRACIKYLMISVQRHTQSVQLTFVTQSPRTSRVINALLKDLVDDLVRSTSSASAQVPLHSIWVNHHYASKHCNTVTGRDADDWRLLYSAEEDSAGNVIEFLDDYDANGNLLAMMQDQAATHESEKSSNKTESMKGEGNVEIPTSSVIPVAKVPLYFPPNVFRQANLGVFRTIVYDIRYWLQNALQELRLANIDCLELYGGVGTIGLHCLDLVRRLVCSDENPNNEACFHRSVAAIRKEISSELAKKATYLTGKSADLAKRGLIHQNFDVLIVDPPRKGLEPEVMEQLLMDDSAVADAMDERKRKVSSAAPKNTKKIFSDEDDNTTNGDRDTATSSSATEEAAQPRTLKRLVYVSCGFEAFQRDCQMLTGDETVRRAYIVSQTTSYPTMVSSAFVPGMGGTVHTHYHHVPTTSASDEPKKKKRKTSSQPQETSAPSEMLVSQLLRNQGIDPHQVLAEDASDPSAAVTIPPRKLGKWRLVYAKGYLMFPGANHIETLAIFDRVNP
jgi:tRNA/tmRNA/rRNA uracil-C5-methylase (TrmA/RlmC/RlmD family)